MGNTKKIKIKVDVGEGEEIPSFYLPVRFLHHRPSIECWFFLLAPFALAYYLFSVGFRTITKDVMDLIRHMENNLKKRK